MSVAETWGTDAAERGLPFPCDRYLDRPDGVYFRGVTIRAGAPAIFRWLCQMRVAQGALMRWGLPWGDLVMMRRQLLNLKALAER